MAPSMGGQEEFNPNFAEGQHPEKVMREKAGWRRIAKKMDQPEGRQHPRALLNLPIEYFADNPGVPRMGHTSNLSPGGVLLNIPEKLDIGQSINLAIFLSLDKTVETIKVNSRVVWVDGTGEDGSFRSGVKFTDISAHDRNKLEKLFE